MTRYNLLMIGCGNMSGALLQGWLDAGLVGLAIVVKPTPLTLTHPAVRRVTPGSAPPDFAPDMIVLGVKPQMLEAVLPAYRDYAGKAPFLSLAAGKTLAYFERALGNDAAVIRTMPNLPATVRKGVTGCAANRRTTDAHRQSATVLLEAVGTVHWIEESQIDALTALSGSGPAYVFLLQEAMAAAGVKLGLEPGLAEQLARETIAGAATLLDRSADTSATLRQRVTSKAGVTEAALKVLMEENALMDLFASALAAGRARAEALAE